MVAVSDRRIRVCKVGLPSLAAGGARGGWCWGSIELHADSHTPYIQCLQYRSQIWDLKFGTFAIKKVPNLGVPNLAPILQALHIISQLNEGDWV